MKYFSPTKFLQRRINKKANQSVISGVFEGMRFSDLNVAAAATPTILGTYEKELSHYFGSGFLKRYKNFIDVGAGEGYFACGVLKNNKSIKCICFEINPDGQDLINKNARLNSFESRIEIYGKADVEILTSKLAILEDVDNLLLIDVEGYELELLNLERFPILKNQDYIIEVHECFIKGAEDALKSRFEATHHLTIIKSQERTMKDFPIKENRIFKWIFRSFYLKLMGEGRPVLMNWFIFTRK